MDVEWESYGLPITTGFRHIAGLEEWVRYTEAREKKRMLRIINGEMGDRRMFDLVLVGCGGGYVLILVVMVEVAGGGWLILADGC